jgi:hypothetical protein
MQGSGRVSAFGKLAFIGPAGTGVVAVFGLAILFDSQP